MRWRIDSALREVGTLFSPVLVQVRFCDLRARDWAMASGGDRQAGIVVLRLALDALADRQEKSKGLLRLVVDPGEVAAPEQ